MKSWQQILVDIGIPEDETRELMDAAVMLASRLDVACQYKWAEMSQRKAWAGQLHNEETIKLLAACILVNWTTEDAATDYGWRHRQLSYERMSAHVARYALRYIGRRRIAWTDDEEED